jgi:hypothetical protein
MKDMSTKYGLKLHLTPQDFDSKTRDVFTILQQTLPYFWRSYEHFESAAHYRDTNISWSYLTAEQAAQIIEQFAALNIVLETEAQTATFLLPADQLEGHTNKWYSGNLINLGENALMDWAESLSISEVYRFTLLPSFTPPITMRVWADGVVRKEGAMMSGVPGSISKLEEWIPSQNIWNSLRLALDEQHFWKDESWYSVPEGHSINDGLRLIYEGYKDGLYKLLHDNSPQQGAAYNLYSVFLNLKPDSE